ncbi:hypothetical protein GJ744_001190 [Endocarpon pusillum]|uniref:Uncharacterized protein n=1 Tax=Endocarpon pusillum TaxID=364733 RepID=A0A8H7A9R0_9EURO|nr:hypothetical protein GJ744_001190 [Endocarpon pusillum]
MTLIRKADHSMRSSITTPSRLDMKRWEYREGTSNSTRDPAQSKQAFLDPPREIGRQFSEFSLSTKLLHLSALSVSTTSSPPYD